MQNFVTFGRIVYFECFLWFPSL